MKLNFRKLLLYSVYALIVAFLSMVVYVSILNKQIDTSKLIIIGLALGAAFLAYYFWRKWQRTKPNTITPEEAMDIFVENLITKERVPGYFVKIKGKQKARIPDSIFKWVDMRPFASKATGNKFFMAEYELNWGDSPGLNIFIAPLSEGEDWVRQYGYARHEHINSFMWMSELNMLRKLPFDHSSDKMVQLLSNLPDMDTDTARMILNSRSGKASLASMPDVEADEVTEEPQGDRQWQKS